jgi:hypothetical protein
MDYNYQPSQSTNYGYNNSPTYTYSATPNQGVPSAHSAHSGPTHSESIGASVDNLAASATGGVNYLLQNQYIRVFVFIVATVYAGYTLLPVPKNLKRMFSESEVFKYFILFFVAASMLHPLDNTKLKICLIVPVFVLLMFRLMRNKSNGKNLFHGIGFRSRSSDQDCSDSESRYSSRRESRSRPRSESDSESSDERSPREEKRMSGAGVAGGVGLGLGAVALGAAVHKGKKDKKSKKGKKGKKGSKSDSVKGMSKAEHFSFI